MRRRRSPPPRARCGSTTSTPATRRRSASASTAWSSSRCRGRATRARPLDDTNLGKYFFEVDRPRDEPASSTRAASPRSTASGRRPARRRTSTRTFSRVAALPGARRRRCRSSLKKRDAQNAFREVWSVLVDPKDMFVDTVEAGLARAARSRSRRRRPRRQGGLPDPGRRLHRGRARQVREGRAAPGGDPLRRLAVQGAARRLQRLGPVPAVGRVGHLAPVDRHPPPLARRRDLRRLRLRALRPDLREPVASATSPPSRPTSSSRS